MLNENLKRLRKAKGLSQEELAAKLHVVRQTVSKWESGLSVPDSEILIRIAEELETSVGLLLGETLPEKAPSELEVLAEKLELLNEQIAKQNAARRKLQRTLLMLLLIVASGSLLLNLLLLMHSYIAERSMQANTAVIGGADGPTAIFVSVRLFPMIASLILILLCGVGLYKIRRK